MWTITRNICHCSAILRVRNIVRIYPYDVAVNVDTTGDGQADEGSLRGSAEIVAGRIRDEIRTRFRMQGLKLLKQELLT